MKRHKTEQEHRTTLTPLQCRIKSSKYLHAIQPTVNNIFKFPIKLPQKEQ